MSDVLNGKKLFVCRTEVVYFVLAEDEREAQGYLSDCLRDGYYDRADYADEVSTAKDCFYEGDWGPSELVYGDHKEEVTLGEAFEAVKAAEKAEAERLQVTARQGGLFDEDKAMRMRAVLDLTKGHKRSECCCVDCCWLRENPWTKEADSA